MQGEGIPFLFLHGYLASKETFAFQIGFFAGFYKVIAPDMTGFGENATMSRPYTLDDYADEISRVLDEIGSDTVYVLAHSFGARVAVRLLSRGEKRISKLVLTGAAGMKNRSLFLKAKKGTFRLLRRFLPKEKLIGFYSSDYRGLSPVMQKSFLSVVNETLDEEYAKIQIPTLLVFGKKDRETPLVLAKRMKKTVKCGKLVVLPDSGHFCFSEKPDRFNGAVLKFLLEGK